MGRIPIYVALVVGLILVGGIGSFAKTHSWYMCC